MTNDEFKRRLSELCREASTENFAEAIQEAFGEDNESNRVIAKERATAAFGCSMMLSIYKHTKHT